MKLKTFQLLKKFMSMTTSDNDHEAMGGLKAANTLLAKEGLTWERVLDRSVKVIAEVEAAPESYDEPAPPPPPRQRATMVDDRKEIDDAIDVIESRANLKGQYESIVTSIIDQHRNGKRLSPKQRDLIMRTADR